MVRHCNNKNTKQRPSKQINVFINGNKYQSYGFVVYRNPWHQVLNNITLKLNPYFGKVEKLYTCDSAITVKSFSKLENHGTYVASNRQKYQNVKGGYTIKPDPATDYFEHYLTTQLLSANKEKKLSFVRRDLIVIYVFRNGTFCCYPCKFVLTQEDLNNWPHTLSFIALIVDMPDRTIKCLYNSNGNQICGPWELQHGATYVAVGYNEKFKQGHYRIKEQTTQALKNGIPIIPRNKHLICKHVKNYKHWKKSLNWKIYCDQYRNEQYYGVYKNNNVNNKAKNISDNSCQIKTEEENSTSESNHTFTDEDTSDTSSECKSIDEFLKSKLKGLRGLCYKTRSNSVRGESGDCFSLKENVNRKASCSCHSKKNDSKNNIATRIIRVKVRKPNSHKMIHKTNKTTSISASSSKRSLPKKDLCSRTLCPYASSSESSSRENMNKKKYFYWESYDKKNKNSNVPCSKIIQLKRIDSNCSQRSEKSDTSSNTTCVSTSSATSGKLSVPSKFSGMKSLTNYKNNYLVNTSSKTIKKESSNKIKKIKIKIK